EGLRSAATKRREPRELAFAQRSEPAYIALAWPRQIEARHGSLDATAPVRQRVNQGFDEAAAEPLRQALKAVNEPLGPVIRRATEHLVAAFAAQYRLHAARGLARQKVERDIGRL